MSITVREIQRVFRYNGIVLPDVPGLSVLEVRDLYSAQYPELVSAEVEPGEVVDGVQAFSFRKAVGVKGASAAMGPRRATLLARARAEAAGDGGTDPRLTLALGRRGVRASSEAWSRCAQRDGWRAQDARTERPTDVPSDMLAPLP